jgi:hypothetical protein
MHLSNPNGMVTDWRLLDLGRPREAAEEPDQLAPWASPCSRKAADYVINSSAR